MVELRQPITLGPGEADTITFMFTPTEAGQYVVRGNGIQASFNVEAPPLDGVQLRAGTQGGVIYGGPDAAIEDAVASIMPYLHWIMVVQNGIQRWYSPNALPEANDLEYIYTGEVCEVRVAAACFWEW